MIVKRTPQAGAAVLLLSLVLSSCGESAEARQARKEVREAIEATGEYSEAQLQKLRSNLEPTIRETRKDLDAAVAEARRKLDALRESGQQITAEQLRKTEEALRRLADSVRRASQRLRGEDTQDTRSGKGNEKGSK